MIFYRSFLLKKNLALFLKLFITVIFTISNTVTCTFVSYFTAVQHSIPEDTIRLQHLKSLSKCSDCNNWMRQQRQTCNCDVISNSLNLEQEMCGQLCSNGLTKKKVGSYYLLLFKTVFKHYISTRHYFAARNIQLRSIFTVSGDLSISLR